MAVKVSYPGVYIEEFTPGGPIEGVGTSTAAFLGPYQYGPLNEPTKLFSWDAFLREFGNPSGVNEPPKDDDYLWYGVRGFFENGGQVCYVIRVSNAKYDTTVLDDDAASQTGAPAAKPTIKVAARKAQNHAPNRISVFVDHVNAVTTKLFEAKTKLASDASKDARVIEVTSEQDAAKFRPGDLILIRKSATAQETATIARVEGKLIRLQAGLGSNYTAPADVRLANPDAETTELRMESSAQDLQRGSVIVLTQGTDPPLVAVVKDLRAEVLPTTTTYRVALQDRLSRGLDFSNLQTKPVNVKSQEFTLTVKQGSTKTPYDNLSMSPNHSRYFVNIVKGDPNGLVNALPVEPPNTTPPPFNRPEAITEANAQDLTGGASENRATLGASEYADALTALERIDRINIVAAPGIETGGVQQKLIEHCEKLKDRFAVLDSWRGAPISGGNSIEQQRLGVTSKYGYAALYYPWLRATPFEGSRPILVPPSGHVAGLYARIDTTRGVHKAPAGTEASMNGVVGLERTFSDAEQGDLNTQGINVIRVFQTGGRAIVWGARTTEDDTNWRYVNIRRLFLFIEESIEEGIRWAVFEPNNLQLWQKVKRSISEFLLRVWRDGALFGEKPEDAFYVRIDEALNPFSEQALGRLNIEIGIRPTYPAEFIIVRIGIWPGGSEISES